MLELRSLTKAYRTASLTQTALDGVTVAFRDNEFVAVLGQSGSGKTTMLNVIGGLDHADSGELVIDGVSTRDYRARDWDAYRNNRIGFVFQSYNLIAHQTVLANVELALTLSGVGRAERRERALAALGAVGLAEHVHKRPSQLSGGQMQRVAIARALINDPEILLADEPTGALDSATSVQVMDLLREIARDRLVVMVTHNPELAEQYATRIVTLADGRVVGDTDPFEPDGAAPVGGETSPPGAGRVGAVTASGAAATSTVAVAAGTADATADGGAPVGPVTHGTHAAPPASAPAPLPASGAAAAPVPATAPAPAPAPPSAPAPAPGTAAARAAAPAGSAQRPHRTRMGALTALALSFSNLMTKKGRTFMTSFAGSIGIIGIAAILALANGVNAYIARTEEKALTSYPLTIERSAMDMTAMLASDASDASDASGTGTATAGAAASGTATAGAAEGTVRTLSGFTRMLGSHTTNDLAALKTYLDADGGGISRYTRAIEYTYDVEPQIYRTDTSDGVVQLNPDQAFAQLSTAASASPLASMIRLNAFTQMPADPSLYEGQYDVLAGHWPTSSHELVLTLNADGTMDDLYEYTLGLRDHTELDSLMAAYLSRQSAGAGGIPVVSGAGNVATAGASATAEATAAASGTAAEGSSTAEAAATPSATATPGASRTYTYADLIGRGFTLVAAADRYEWDASYKVWTERSDDEDFMRDAIAKGEELRIVGIVQPKEKDEVGVLSGIGYLPSLTQEVMDTAAASTIVKDQLADPDRDVFTGKTFAERAAGSTGDELDLSSLFTVDGEAIRSAFRVDPSALQSQMGSLDLSGISVPALDLGSISLSGLDPGSLDLSGAGDIDLSGLDLSSLDMSDLAQRYPKLAEVDYPTIIAKALSDGAVKDTAGDYLSGVTTSILSGFTEYAAAHPAPDADGDGAPDTDLAALVQEYLATAKVTEQLTEAASSDQVIDRERLTANLTAALGEDPALSEVAGEIGQRAATAIAQQVAAQVGSKVATAVSHAMQTAFSQAVSGAMTQMMTSLQAQISAQMQQAMSNLAAGMSSAMSIDEDAFRNAFHMSMDTEQLSDLLATLMSTTTTSYDSNLASLGWADEANPSSISIYPTDFESKDAVKAVLEDYNASQVAAGHDDRVITYTDMVGMLMSSVTRIINVITWMLVAFVSISLIVSSIMIAIITYISVLERRKEIGILRAIGASRADIRHVFNAETVIEGLLAGLLGVGIALLISVPVNLVVDSRFGVYPIAQLPAAAGAVLVAISVVLTLVAGLVPAARAAREDPVEALRSE